MLVLERYEKNIGPTKKILLKTYWLIYHSTIPKLAKGMIYAIWATGSVAQSLKLLMLFISIHMELVRKHRWLTK